MAAQNRPTHAWTYEERVCVHILCEEHTLTRDDRVKVFNKLFNDRLAVGKSDLPRTSESLSKERSKRHHHGSCSWKAWQDICSGTGDDREQNMVNRMRVRVDRLLRSNSEPATPPQSVSSNYSAHTTAHLCDIAQFANFTESVARKRNIAALYTPSSTTDEQAGGFEDAPRPKRCRRAPRDQSPTVMIPKALDFQTPHDVVYAEEPATIVYASGKISKTARRAAGTQKSLPVTKSQAHSNEGAPILYQRMGNMPLMLSPAHHKNAPPTEAPYNDISEKHARPYLPPVLLRYYDSSSQGANSANGFKSGKSAHARVPLRGPPLCKDLEWMDVLEHLNPSNNSELRIHTPFISTSSRLLWILRKALRKGDPSGCISLIDSSVLDPQGVYYVPPFHSELKKRFVFDHGAQYYKGISERLVWNEIGSSAMIKTVSLDDFCAFVNGNREVKRLMRLDKIASPGKLDEISRTFKRDGVKITDSIAVAIAELVMFFGLDHTSGGEKLSCLVYEIAQGWALTPESVAQSSWQAKAHWFTHTICRRSDEPVNFDQQSRIYHAFLDGLRWSCGDVNVRLKGPKACATTQKRAAKVGLGRTAYMVIEELESTIVAFQSPLGSSQYNELEAFDQTPSRHVRVKSTWSRRQLMSGEGETESAIHSGLQSLLVGNEGNHGGSGHQPEILEEDEDGSDTVVTGRREQSLDHTLAFSDYEDEIVYE